MKKFFTLLSFLLFTTFLHAQIRYLKGILEGAQEVPSNGSTASGVVLVKYNTTTKLLELWGDYNGLAASASASHIHSPAAPGSNAPVLITLINTGGITGTLRVTATLTMAQETDLLGELMYVNVHNASFPGGEIRAQLTTMTNLQTEFYSGRLQGAQEVPPNSSTASGAVYALLDKVKDSIYLTGNFSGLTAAASAAHIHAPAAPGANAGVIQNLQFTTAVSGTLHVAVPISAGNETNLMNGNAYVNVHNATYPGGEIRAQLTRLGQMRFFTATLDGTQEVPSNASTAVGTAIVKYDPETKLLELTGDYQNLTAAVSASHIHSPAAPGANAPILITLTNTGGTSGTLTGSATLTTPEETDLMNGLFYVNVHNASFPGGEIRGQLNLIIGAAFYFTGNLQGSQEVPASGSAGTGAATVVLDRATNNVFVTGSFSGLTGTATAAHIHQGATGSTGSIVVPLTVTAASSGTVTGSGTVTSAVADLLITGMAYLNIHSTAVPSGELRAQLGGLVLPLKLGYFNGYRNGNKVTLLWETLQELNLSNFELQQQDPTTGVWITKQRVVARGGAIATKYKFEDVPTIGNKNYVFYRLKMIDADGKTAYSSIIRINLQPSKAGITIQVNPVVNDRLAFTITGLAREQKATVVIADYNGRVITKTIVSSLQNNSINIAQLSTGIYKLVVTLDSGVVQESFMKQ